METFKEILNYTLVSFKDVEISVYSLLIIFLIFWWKTTMSMILDHIQQTCLHSDCRDIHQMYPGTQSCHPQDSSSNQRSFWDIPPHNVPGHEHETCSSGIPRWKRTDSRRDILGGAFRWRVSIPAGKWGQTWRTLLFLALPTKLPLTKLLTLVAWVLTIFTFQFETFWVSLKMVNGLFAKS